MIPISKARTAIKRTSLVFLKGNPELTDRPKSPSSVQGCHLIFSDTELFEGKGQIPEWKLKTLGK